jgi:hypothetical protein
VPRYVGQCLASYRIHPMTETDLADEPSKLTHQKSSDEPTEPTEPQEEDQQPEPQTGSYKLKPTLPKLTLPKNELDLPQAPRPPPSTSATDRTSSELLTRRQSADYIRHELGRPMSFSTANKLAALGEFAEPRVWWGKRPLYARDDLRQWVEARSRPTKQPVVEDTSCDGHEL